MHTNRNRNGAVFESLQLKQFLNYTITFYYNKIIEKLANTFCKTSTKLAELKQKPFYLMAFSY